MQATIDQIPILAGVLEPAQTGRDAERGLPIIRDGGQAHLIVKYLTEEIQFSDLKDGNFPSRKLNPDVLVPVPRLNDPVEAKPILKVQATLIDGGVLLVISCHHIAADGAGISIITRALAAQCRHAASRMRPFADSLHEVGDDLNKTPSTLSARALDRSPLQSGSLHAVVHDQVGVYKIIASDNAKIPRTAVTSSDGLVTRVFSIEPETLKTLKGSAEGTLSLGHQSETDSKDRWISTHDAVVALIWRTILGARLRLGMLTAEETVYLGLAHNIRRKVTPPLPDDFIGNATICVDTHLPLGNLLKEHDGLSVAARSIRDMVHNVNNDTVQDLISFIKSVDNIKQIRNDSTVGLAENNRIFVTSWHSFPSDAQDFGGNTFGRFEAIRLPNGGLPYPFQLILPRRRDGAWEIALTLKQEVMGEVEKDELWQRYTRETT